MSTKPKTASLTGTLVAKKGAAAPSAPQAVATPKPPETGTGYYKALTFKLDRTRYNKLKTLGLELDKSTQDLLSEALDDLLRKML